jgi:hypothetical protein
MKRRTQPIRVGTTQRCTTAVGRQGNTKAGREGAVWGDAKREEAEHDDGFGKGRRLVMASVA